MSARIRHVRVAAAHEGVAELVVELEYDGGGISEVPLDAHASHALMLSCDASTAEELVGQPWEAVRDALGVSWNRFQESLKHQG